MVTIVSTPRMVSSSAPVMICPVDMTSWVGRMGISFTSTLKKDWCSSSSSCKNSSFHYANHTSVQKLDYIQKNYNLEVMKRRIYFKDLNRQLKLFIFKEFFVKFFVVHS